MNRFLMLMLFFAAVALGALPANAVTITYSTSGSNAQVFLTPTSSGNISGLNSSFSLSEVLDFGDTSNGHYGQAYTYIPFTVTNSMTLHATVTDLAVSDPGAKPLDWLTLSLFTYTGSKYTNCGASALCTLEAYDSDPPSASIFAGVVAGTQYLLKIGFGLCGCAADYAGINLTVTTTPIPPALLLFMSALLGMGAMVWRRQWAAGKAFITAA
ncbi:hypothetical protein [Dongia sp.]|uniref:hypothetical protein n=1 Tax=Dongia sp. TaxID=1977262 RepID=UPI0037522DAF